MRRLALALVLGLAAPLGGQGTARPTGFDLSVPNIMRGPELYGRPPQRVRFAADGRWIYFSWAEPGTAWREPMAAYRVRAEPGARPEKVPDARMDTVGPLLAQGPLSPDRRWRAVVHDGDLFLVDVRRGTARRLTQTLAAESRPAWAAGARELYYVRDNNVFALDLGDGMVRQLTDVRTGPAPRDSARAAGQRALLEAQQRELFEAVRDRLHNDSVAKVERARRDSMRVKPLYLDTRERIADLAVSPDGRALLIATSIPAERARQTEVPQYVTASGYTEQLRVRDKVGDAQERGRVAFLALPSGQAKWLQVTPGDTVNPAAQVNLLGWTRDGSRAALFAVSRDFKRRWLHVITADSGRLTTVDELRDSAWVGGPCMQCGGWYEGGRRIWYVSEADGWAHLYSVGADGSGRTQLTRGAWEVLDAELSPDEREFRMHTSEPSLYEQHFYRMPVNGGARTRITTQPGAHEVTVSPDGEWLADVHSYANRPPELYLMRNRPGAPMSQLTTSTTAEWRSHPWITPAIVEIPASDGKRVPARIYRPQDVGAQPNGAAVIFVHGAGYLHNVHNYWSSYAREYMFNHLLASRGYVVLDLDYRGSAGYGRDWRTAIYRHMGGRDLQDHVDASKWLASEHRIDPERVGIYGGSYGGFITLMALFTAPEHFGAGAALRSVTDWAHYNHWYTARILNDPAVDTLSYRRSSPIYFAQGLQDPLLIAHGMVDVNVHFQDVVRLSQRLIELGKTDWELAVYPVEDHGFVRPSSWTDEYRRILELFERALRADAPRTAGQPRAAGGP